METANTKTVTIETVVNAPIEKIWKYWTEPGHVKKWNAASADWHTTHAENDLRVGGNFTFRMEAKDGSFGFDFGGTYDAVNEHEYIEYTLGDGRKVKTDFTKQGNAVKVVETFDAENTHPVDFQKAGWQAILDNFKKYAEEN
jgi:uncharacterized protein YndB with AHSA1/START domain